MTFRLVLAPVATCRRCTCLQSVRRSSGGQGPRVSPSLRSKSGARNRLDLLLVNLGDLPAQLRGVQIGGAIPPLPNNHNLEPSKLVGCGGPKPPRLSHKNQCLGVVPVIWHFRCGRRLGPRCRRYARIEMSPVSLKLSNTRSGLVGHRTSWLLGSNPSPPATLPRYYGASAPSRNWPQALPMNKYGGSG